MDLREKYSQALEAIELLESLHPGFRLEMVPIIEQVDEKHREQDDEIARALFGPTNRDKVKSATKAKPRTIDEIVDLTGMTKRQIRGAINAPDIRESFDRHELPDGRTQYRYVGT